MTLQRLFVIVFAFTACAFEYSNVLAAEGARRSFLNSAGSAKASADEVWFNQKVDWKYGKDGSPWKTISKNPSGTRVYQLILRPLWVLEGGVSAIEIVIAHPEQPDLNLLGTRKNKHDYPFVVTVRDLQTGLAHSKFGAVRILRCDDIVLSVRVKRFRLGKGIGSLSTHCANCRNLQEISMWIIIKST